MLEAMGHPAQTFAPAGECLGAKMCYLACLISDATLDAQLPEMTGSEWAAQSPTTGGNIPILLVIRSPSAATPLHHPASHAAD